MCRAPRADEADGIYHALNHGNARHPIFFKEGDFEAFERIIVEGLQKFSVRLSMDREPIRLLLLISLVQRKALGLLLMRWLCCV